MAFLALFMLVAGTFSSLNISFDYWVWVSTFIIFWLDFLWKLNGKLNQLIEIGSRNELLDHIVANVWK